MKLRSFFQVLPILFFLATIGSAFQSKAADPIKAMVLTGQNNHGWEVLSARYVEILEETGLFEVDSVCPHSTMTRLLLISPRRGTSGLSFYAYLCFTKAATRLRLVL